MRLCAGNEHGVYAVGEGFRPVKADGSAGVLGDGATGIVRLPGDGGLELGERLFDCPGGLFLRAGCDGGREGGCGSFRDDSGSWEGLESFGRGQDLRLGPDMAYVQSSSNERPFVEKIEDSRGSGRSRERISPVSSETT